MRSLQVRLGLKYSYLVRRLSSPLNDENQKFLSVFPLMCSFFHLLICIPVDKLKFTMKCGREKERGKAGREHGGSKLKKEDKKTTFVFPMW